MLLPIPDLMKIIMKYAEPFDRATHCDTLEFFAEYKILFSGTFQHALENGLKTTIALWLKKDKTLSNKLIANHTNTYKYFMNDYNTQTCKYQIHPLSIAIQNNQIKTVHSLIINGSSINRKHFSYLMLANRLNKHMMNLLLNNSKQMELELLHTICFKYKSKFIKDVLNRDFKWINEESKHIKILFILAKKNYTSIIKLVLKKKIKLSLEDISETLFYCIEKDHFKIFEVIMNEYSTHDFRNANGESLLICACKHINCQIAKTLIKYGVDVNAQDNNGKTSLMYLCVNNQHITTLLKKYNLIVPKKPMRSTHNKILERLNIIKLLLKTHANVNIIDYCGYGLISYILEETSIFQNHMPNLKLFYSISDESTSITTDSSHIHKHVCDKNDELPFNVVVVN